MAVSCPKYLSSPLLMAIEFKIRPSIMAAWSDGCVLSVFIVLNISPRNFLRMIVPDVRFLGVKKNEVQIII